MNSRVSPQSAGLNYFSLTKVCGFDTASKEKTIIANGHFLYTSKSVYFKDSTLLKPPENTAH